MAAKLRVFSVSFRGVYPVGAVAVVVDRNKATALENFKIHLRKVNPGLAAKNKDLDEKDVQEISVFAPGVTILLNGDY